MIVLVLLAVNYLSVALFAPGKEKSVRIPYSPEFLSQVDKGNVAKISSTGATVSGELKKEITYPPGDKDAEPTKNFDTEIPIVRQRRTSSTRSCRRRTSRSPPSRSTPAAAR